MPEYEQRSWLRIPEGSIHRNDVYLYPSGERSIFIVQGFKCTISQLTLLYEHKILGIPQRQIARNRAIGFQTIQNDLQRLKHYNAEIDLNILVEKARGIGLLDTEVLELLTTIVQNKLYRDFPSTSVALAYKSVGE